jgi:hypothetical protein
MSRKARMRPLAWKTTLKAEEEEEEEEETNLVLQGGGADGRPDERQESGGGSCTDMVWWITDAVVLHAVYVVGRKVVIQDVDIVVYCERRWKVALEKNCRCFKEWKCFKTPNIYRSPVGSMFPTVVAPTPALLIVVSRWCAQIIQPFLVVDFINGKRG